MLNEIFLLLIPSLPLAGFVLLGLLGKKYLKNISGILETLLLLASFLLALYTAYEYFFVVRKADGIYQKIIPFQYTWLQFSDSLSINMGALIDPISVLMLVIITFISLMVHIYSLGYMKGEERFSTYYSFLGLFTFSMLGLVMSSNIFQIYIFWELVGISSFLLIGFYYEKPSAVAACKKAFIVTRFADLGFLIGILILSFYSGTLDFNTLIERLTSPGSPQLQNAIASSFLGISALTWGMVLVFMGGAGKSAMLPFHIWLPDAMEGPTPVSALIHAATMVVAGVYLVARLFPVFALSTPDVLQLIAYVGAITALFAAIIACTQTDIKRVLAFSTISQIGYMMFALGVSDYDNGGLLGHSNLGYTASMFHLFTHAMFKALLFLGAGSVIHFIHSNEMKDMGGLRKYLPVTHITFLIACLSISGIPPFAGFFSKEDILLAASQNNLVIYWIGLVTSGITAFYMFRLYFSIFWNKTPSHPERARGKASIVMIIPLILLAIGAAFAGFVPFDHFVTSNGIPFETVSHWQFSILPVAFGLAGILIALKMYKRENALPGKLSASLGGFYKASFQKFYVDEIYLFITHKIIFNLIGRPAAWLDKNVVNGLVNATGNSTENFSAKIKKVQSGKVQHYAVYFLIATIIIAAIFIYWWK